MIKLNLKKRTSIDSLLLVLKGIAMGAANKVPGVSGGVVAFVGGFYEEFIYSLQKLNFTAFKLFFGFRFSAFWSYINGSFLGLLITGMLISFFSVSKLLDYLLVRFEVFVWSAFFGMIIGSVIYLYKIFEQWTARNILFAVLSMCIGLAISSFPPASENDNLVFVFLCGIIGVSGMTLPGLSGSFILIILGNYVLLLVDSVNTLFDTIVFLYQWNFDFMENSTHMRMLTVLVVFSLGSLAGLVILSNLLGILLKKHKGATFASIIGFIIGSLGVVWPWKNKVFKRSFNGDILKDINGNSVLDYYHRYLPELLSWNTLVALGFIFFGVVFVLLLERLGSHKNRAKKSQQNV